MINVTDLTKYLYCPRQFYLEKVKGIKKPVTKEMVIGRIKHKVLETFSKEEESLVKKIEQEPLEEIKDKYYCLLEGIIKQILKSDEGSSQGIIINKIEVLEKIKEEFADEINIRLSSIEKTRDKGFFNKEIWENLEPKIISEFSVISDSLGLKGRVDRVVIEFEKIVPFELKTRVIEKVFESDEIQIVSYAMLIEDYFNQKIDFGIVQAGGQKFQVDITDLRKKKVLELIKEINESKSVKYPSNFSKCERCLYKEECESL